MKIKRGEVISSETGKKANIIVKAVAPNHIKEIIVGRGFIVGGIIYLTATAFAKRRSRI